MKSSEIEIIDSYEKQANNFATKYGIKLIAIGEPEYDKYFPNDTRFRYIFKMKLMREGKSYTFKYGQSIANDCQEPTMYDVLACLTKYDVGSYEDFLLNFGYNRDAQSKKVYNAVCKEYIGVERLFGDILEELSEIA